MNETPARPTLADGQVARLPGATRDASLHDQLYRYAEDLQHLVDRQGVLEAECSMLRDVCSRLTEDRSTIEALIGRTQDIHLVTDPQGKIVHCNPAAKVLADPLHLIGSSLRRWVQPSYHANYDALLRQALASGAEESEWELRLQREGLAHSHLIVSAIVIATMRDGSVHQLQWIFRDITKLREVQFESQISSMVFNAASEGLMITDVEGEILAVNPAFTSITGYSSAEVVGRKPQMLRSGMHDSAFYEKFWRSLRERGTWKGEIYNRRKNGEIYPEWLTVNAARDSDGHVLSYIAVFSDLSRILQTERRLAYLAHHDMLTGLPNRLLFQDRLAQGIAQGQRSGTPLTLIFIDLDKFKQVNDTLGHEIGDIVLKETAARLAAAVRQVDTVGRLGGDEFVVIAPEVGTANAVSSICTKIIAAVSEPIVIDTHEVFIGASLGCAIWPEHGADEAQLLKNADNAMYRAKALGGNVHVIHEAGSEGGAGLLSLESELRLALEKNELRLEYQPQVAASDGALLGVEALLRWDHPVFGSVPPARFIPVAEHSGQILPIGAWVLETACRQLAEWDRQGMPRLTMAVNLSPRQLRDPGLVATVRSVLATTGLDASRLEIEVTESELMHHLDVDRGKLSVLREIGVRIAIDDFGTGYSSLARLMQLPIDSLKLDRSFVNELENDANGRAGAITDAIVRMGLALGVSLVAEGVETPAQYDLLARQGCQVIQGYLTGRPMRPEDLVRTVGDAESVTG